MFGLFQRRTKSTRKRNTPENAGHRPFPESAFLGVLRFRVCFGALLEGNKEHPKTQHTRKRRFWKRSMTCVFGCVCVFGCFLAPANYFFEPPNFLSSVSFAGKMTSCQKKILHENPWQILQDLNNKNPWRISADRPAKETLSNPIYTNPL